MRKLTIGFIFMAFIIAGNLNAQDTFRGSLEYDGIERIFNVFIPSAYSDEGDPLPLVIALHPSGGGAGSMSTITGFDDIAEREGFVVLYPSGPGGYWDYGAGTPGWERVPDLRDDPGFLSALLDSALSELNIDPLRVYALGFSNGARMAFRMGCDLGDRLAAVAGVSATISDEITENCLPDSRVSVMFMHGTADAITPWEGKPLFIGNLVISNALSAPDTVTFWREHNGCDAEPADSAPHSPENIVGTVRYTGCDSEREVLFHGIHNGGHEWFNVDEADFNASEAIWAFFAANPRMAESTIDGESTPEAEATEMP